MGFFLAEFSAWRDQQDVKTSIEASALRHSTICASAPLHPGNSVWPPSTRRARIEPGELTAAQVGVGHLRVLENRVEENASGELGAGEVARREIGAGEVAICEQ